MFVLLLFCCAYILFVLQVWDLLDPENPDPVDDTIQPSQVRKASQHVTALLAKFALDKEWWYQPPLVQSKNAEVTEKQRVTAHNKKLAAAKVIYM